jgi:uncharacterized Zn finger protein (UPF0148 family)
MNNNETLPSLPEIDDQSDPNGTDNWLNKGSRLQTQQACPVCQVGRLVFDGCLNLTCPTCGFTQTGGGFT